MTTLATDPAEATFLAAILENPAEDTHRLVYADWLDENGQPERAEFMRVQVELARNPNGSTAEMTADQWHQLRRRERNLRGAYAPQWYSFGRYAACSVWDHSPFIRWCQPPYETDVITGDDSRGFVSHVTITAAAFLGGECGRCARGWMLTGEVDGETGHPVEAACPACRGTGRTEGLARELFAAHPIERVTLSDREPDDNVHTAPSWTWWEGEIGDDSDRIPKDVFDLIDLPSCFDMGEWRKSADTRDAALAALSAACVAHGRSRAGLPPLPSGQPAASS